MDSRKYNEQYSEQQTFVEKLSEELHPNHWILLDSLKIRNNFHEQHLVPITAVDMQNNINRYFWTHKITRKRNWNGHLGIKLLSINFSAHLKWLLMRKSGSKFITCVACNEVSVFQTVGHDWRVPFWKKRKLPTQIFINRGYYSLQKRIIYYHNHNADILRLSAFCLRHISITS